MDIVDIRKDFVVAEKPPGIPAQRDLTGDRSMEEMLAEELSVRGASYEGIYVVHRLDRGVGGLMVYGLTKAGARELGRGMDRFDKTYRAVCLGSAPDEGELRNFVMRKGRTNLSVLTGTDGKNAKEAVLTFQKIGERQMDGETASLLKIKLVTGRHHQIRLQLSAAGLPIWGDVKYGFPQTNKAGARLCNGIALFASDLGFGYKGKAYSYSKVPESFPFCVF